MECIFAWLGGGNKLNQLKKIQPLDELTISQIAAGEVIEHPASVIKELVENSIDSGARQIEVFVRSGGFESIQVRDDGGGIFKDDLPLAIKSFATSKLSRMNDLYEIESYGFRGEALGAIASIANISIESKEAHSEVAYRVTKEVDSEARLSPASLPKGTKVVVSDLFHKLPVRKEFNQNPNKIKKSMIDVVSNFALCYPSITYTLSIDQKTVIDVSSAEGLSERIKQLFSEDFLDSLIPVYHQDEQTTLEGYISGFQFYKTHSDHIRFFMNRRSVIYKKLIRILKKVYGELMPPGRFPVAFLFLDVPCREVDVNVHPQKSEVRFREEPVIENFLYRAIRENIDSHQSLRLKHLSKAEKRTSAEYKKIDFTAPLHISDNSEKTLKYSAPAPAQAGIMEPGQPKEESSPASFETGPQKKNSLFFSELKLHEKLYETFIVATSEEGIYLFDQHTIHERVNYERFLQKLNEKQSTRQELLAPIPLGLSLSEKVIVQQNKDLLDKIGFEVGEIGPGEYGILSVPFYVGRSQEEEAFQICLRQMLDHEKPGETSLNPLEIFDGLAASLACRSAVKKGDPEPLSRIRELIQELQKCEKPLRCPHGRPTTVFLGKDDISTLFKRG